MKYERQPLEDGWAKDLFTELVNGLGQGRSSISVGTSCSKIPASLEKTEGGMPLSESRRPHPTSPSGKAAAAIGAPVDEPRQEECMMVLLDMPVGYGCVAAKEPRACGRRGRSHGEPQIPTTPRNPAAPSVGTRRACSPIVPNTAQDTVSAARSTSIGAVEASRRAPSPRPGGGLPQLPTLSKPTINTTSAAALTAPGTGAGAGATLACGPKLRGRPSERSSAALRRLMERQAQSREQQEES